MRIRDTKQEMPDQEQKPALAAAAAAAPINFVLKAKYAFYSTLIFFLVANPETFKMTQKVFGWLFQVADAGGCPTAIGFFFHSALFFVVLWGAMLFPRD